MGKESTNIFNPQAKILANADRALQHIETGYTPPVLIEVDPSNACNHACDFCLSSYIHFDKYKGSETFSRALMPRDMLMNLCKDFVSMGVRAVNWTGGGEPTLNKHLKEAIEYCGQNNIKMGMFTNGTLLDKWDMFDTLVDNMTWVRFSIDEGKKSAYSEIRKAKNGRGWDKMVSNLTTLTKLNAKKGHPIDIGVGYVITPDNYENIVEFAKFFSQFDLTYCQYKPEVVIREDGGQQREREFWLDKVRPLLDEARQILGDKFQVNEYKLVDLENDREKFGREYKKCLGSQVQPCVGADGHVYVCTNHRGWKQYSYGSLYDEKSFKDIWQDMQARQEVMSLIEEKECFSNCTSLCKPHESNKMMWNLYSEFNVLSHLEKIKFKEDLMEQQERVKEGLKHPEFI